MAGLGVPLSGAPQSPLLCGVQEGSRCWTEVRKRETGQCRGRKEEEQACGCWWHLDQSCPRLQPEGIRRADTTCELPLLRRLMPSASFVGAGLASWAVEAQSCSDSST